MEHNVKVGEVYQVMFGDDYDVTDMVCVTSVSKSGKSFRGRIMDTNIDIDDYVGKTEKYRTENIYTRVKEAE